MIPYYPPSYVLVSGGKDSLSTAQVLADADRLLGCVALGTGISTPEWRDFLITTCTKRGWPLEFHHTPDNFDRLVRKYGFPGPGMHQQFMTYLKGRAIREFRRKHPNGVLASGTRSGESQRRFVNAKPISFWEGVPILAPIYDWSTDETWAFFNKHGFERAPAYQTLMVSGDCLCGAFAVQGEAEMLRLGYPTIADRFDELGREIQDAFPKRCKWGWGWQEKRKRKSAREASLCQECGDNADLFSEVEISA
jgi:3'-phosphoadenosine 5'-phosphosulfate sulfotransferase (PAPS reductase)/FAD synthetase